MRRRLLRAAGRIGAAAVEGGLKPAPTNAIRNEGGASPPEQLCFERLVGLREGVFVGAGAVDRGDGDLEQAEVDGELAAVMVEVVEHDVADEFDTRHRDDFFASCREAPGRGGCGFGQAFDEFLRGFGAGLECVEDFLLVSGLRGSKRGGIDFVYIVLRDARDAARDAGDVIRQFADGHGFGVRRPVEFIGGDAIENAAGGGGFSLEFIQHGGKGLPHFESPFLGGAIGWLRVELCGGVEV